MFPNVETIYIRYIDLNEKMFDDLYRDLMDENIRLKLGRIHIWSIPKKNGSWAVNRYKERFQEIGYALKCCVNPEWPDDWLAIDPC